MKFFSLGSWLDDFSMGTGQIDDINADEGIRRKIYTLKSLASSLYNFNIEDAELLEFDRKGKEVTIQDIEDIILEKVNIDEFYLNSIKDFSEIYLNKDMIDLESADYLNFFRNMTSEIIANIAIMAYITEKYQNQGRSRYTLRELYNKRDDKKETPADYAYYSNQCNFLCFNTILGQLFGINVKYKKDGKTIDRYLLPKFQSDLLGNIISGIKLSNFKKHIDDPLQSKITETKKEYKTFIPSKKFINYLFFGFNGDDINIDNIVTLYIIERVFNFNLIFEASDALERSRIDANGFSIEQDIISDIIRSFYKNPIVSSRPKYIKAIMRYKEVFNRRTQVTNELLGQHKNYISISRLFLSTDKFGELISWQENINRYMSYLNLYFVPLIENVFNLFFLKVKALVRDANDINKKLEDYILSKEYLKQGFDTYKRKIYHLDNIKSNDSVTPVYYCEPIPSETFNEPPSDAMHTERWKIRKQNKKEIVNQLYKLSHSAFDIDYSISFDHRLQKNIHRFHLDCKIKSVSQNAESSVIKREKERLISGTISKLLYERSLLKEYTDIKYICQNCDGFSVVDIINCLKEEF